MDESVFNGINERYDLRFADRETFFHPSTEILEFTRSGSKFAKDTAPKSAFTDSGSRQLRTDPIVRGYIRQNPLHGHILRPEHIVRIRKDRVMEWTKS